MKPIEITVHCKPEHVYRKQEMFRWSGYEVTYLKWVNQYRVIMVFKKALDKENVK